MKGYYTGRVSSIDSVTGRVKVTYPTENNIVSDWLPLLAFEYNMPAVGDLVATVVDEFGNGVCFGKIFSFSQPPTATSGYKKEISNISITEKSGTFTIKFNDSNYIEWRNGTMNIRADRVNIINNDEV